MKVTHASDLPRENVTGPLFTGAVTVRSALSDEEGSEFNVAHIDFPAGVHSRLHRHTTDQVLIVTRGKGMVATENEQVELTVGDVVHAPAGEKHWHGAVTGSAMTHISITGRGSDVELLEP